MCHSNDCNAYLLVNYTDYTFSCPIIYMLFLHLSYDVIFSLDFGWGRWICIQIPSLSLEHTPYSEL